MEKTVRILNQSALMTRQYVDKKTGEQKVINSVTLKLTDGIDTFLGEMTQPASTECSALWRSGSGIHSRPARLCRLRRSTWIK